MRFLPLLEKISPSLVARLGYRIFNNPQSRKFRPFEQAILEQAKQQTFSFQNHQMTRYEWGDGPAKALLVHGWEGRASNFGKIVPMLVKKGYTVTSFDCPGHGQSERTENPFLDFAAMVKQFLQEQSYDLILTHSMGSIITIWGLHDLKLPVQQMIVCTTPDTLEDRFAMTVKELGLTDKTQRAMMQLFTTSTGLNPNDLQGNRFAPSLEFEELLFISDVNDKILPLAWTRAVQEAAPGSELLLIEGTGHFRMLWSEQLVELLGQRIPKKA
ncbi:MAG: alpha/beta hydrolase [Bacteroidota bacterium]